MKSNEHATKIFISYSHKDKSRKERLIQCIQALPPDMPVPVDAWDDRRLLAGDNFDDEIFNKISETDIFIALVSIDYLASKYCRNEMYAALQKAEKGGQCRIVPVIVGKNEVWQRYPLGKHNALPKDGKAPSDFVHEDEYWSQVQAGLLKLLSVGGAQNSVSHKSPSNDTMRDSMDHSHSPELEVYLSYSRSTEQRIPIIHQLNEACRKNNIRLVFDEGELKLGDSIGKFMDELSQARFVVLALSPDYFKSAYCMRELVDLFEWDYMRHRVIPVIHERVDNRELQEIRAMWSSHSDRLGILGYKDSQYNKLIERINAAFKTVIESYFDLVNRSLDQQTPDFNDLIDRLRNRAEHERKQDIEELQKFIRKKLIDLLDKTRFEQFRRECAKMAYPGMTNSNPAECARWLAFLPADKALDNLHDMAKQCRPDRSIQSETFKNYAEDIQSLGCWLILGSISPDWWLLNKFKLSRLKSNKVGVSLNIDEENEAYVEIVLARRDFYQPGIKRGPAGVISRNDSRNFPAQILDLAIAQQDRFQAFLLSLYNDLLQGEPDVSDTAVLIKRLKNRFKNWEGRLPDGSRRLPQFYYLVSSKHYKNLQNTGLLNQIEVTFPGSLHLIALDPSQSGVPVTDHETVLDKLAMIFELFEEKKNHADNR
ncbi:MAG: toll/interleukin-1 receptor domain-containing protein [Methylococcales bacterium]